MICKENPTGEEKSCQKPNKDTCEKECSKEQYCSREKICKNGNLASIVPILPICTLLVPCGTNGDCEDVPDADTCKEDKNGERTCQKAPECSCMEEEICKGNGVCVQPGNNMNDNFRLL